MKYLIIIAILIIIIIIVWILYQEKITPTMYSKCINNKECGGDLICDCRRCKKQLGGDCAVDYDCETGLYCNNWICSEEPEIRLDEIDHVIENDKHIKWKN